jgi:hypothetical protein
MEQSFWTIAQQYVNLSRVLASTISTLSGNNVWLPNVVYLVTAGKQISKTTFSETGNLIDSEQQLDELKRLWFNRADQLTGLSHQALLRDPRPQFREFVKLEPMIAGSAETRKFDNTGFLDSVSS